GGEFGVNAFHRGHGLVAGQGQQERSVGRNGRGEGPARTRPGPLEGFGLVAREIRSALALIIGGIAELVPAQLDQGILRRIGGLRGDCDAGGGGHESSSGHETSIVAERSSNVSTCRTVLSWEVRQ